MNPCVLVADKKRVIRGKLVNRSMLSKLLVAYTSSYRDVCSYPSQENLNFSTSTKRNPYAATKTTRSPLQDIAHCDIYTETDVDF